MKKNLTFPFVLLLVFALNFINHNSFAEEVDISTAKNVAINLYTERAGSPIQNIGISSIFEEKEKGETVYYILTFSEKGYAIIAADDRVYPVLAYSTENNYDPTNIPDGTRWLLNKYKRQILQIKKQDIPASEETQSDWIHFKSAPQNFTKDPIDMIEPLISTKWGQGEHFNDLCPEDTNHSTGHTVVGCVATAMAQILNYWNNPWKGNGNHSYVHPVYGEQSADFHNALYNFDNMPDTVASENSDVATLSYHCAVSVNMDFGPESSSAYSEDVEDALKNYFYFDDGVQYIEKSSNSSEWDNILHNELDNFRPVYYSGRDENAQVGHAWVLDGYQGTNHYHMNWGWYGNSNDYFYLDDLTPGEEWNFGTDQAAVKGILQQVDYLSGTLTAAGGPYYFRKYQAVLSTQTLTIEPGTEIYFVGRYHLSVYGQLLAVGTETDSITFSSETPEVGWQGIRFYNTNNLPVDSSKVVYCNLENGKGSYDALPYHNNNTQGGAIYSKSSNRVLITNNLIKNNSAGFGGAIHCYFSDVRLENCLIRNNFAAESGGGMFIANSNALLSNNLIRSNLSYGSGGGVYWSNSNISFDKDTIRNNDAASWGAGIAIATSDAIMDSVVIYNNHAFLRGGGIGSLYSNIELINCQLYDNLADKGGALYSGLDTNVHLNNTLIHHNLATHGSALYIYDANMTLSNVTLSHNNPYAYTDEEGIFVENGNITIENSILWNNLPEDIDTSGTCSVTASYSIIQNGNWPGNEVINSDPLFWDPYTWNYQLSWSGYPMPDAQKSAAIDGGNPASPNDPDGTRADMGYIPYEQVYTSISGGEVNGTWYCSESPYYVFGDINIPVGQELIIEPCVHVMFRGDYQFEVFGRLLAEGDEYNQITFAATDTIECWQGLKIVNTDYNGQDSSKFVNCRITFGSADIGGPSSNSQGGAIYFKSSSDILVENCLMNKNYAANAGGAMYLEGSLPDIINNTFSNNSSPLGGAMYFAWGYPVIQGGIIENNEAESGGACFLNGSNPTFSGVTIRNNNAKFGGGIYMYGGCTPVFDPVNLCNIYMNYAYAAGLDFCAISWWGYPIVINVDTFTVINSNSHFVYPEDIYTANIQNGVIEQTNEDLYVSMAGSDENAGTDPSEPLKTMYMALMKIQADSTDPKTIHLDEGTFSQGATGELLPVNCREYVSLSGEGTNKSVIYGENINQLLFAYDDSEFDIDSLKLNGGYAEEGGAIHLENYSSPVLKELRIEGNTATGSGGGIFCSYNSSPIIENTIIYDNFCEGNGGGISITSNCNPHFNNITLQTNHALYQGGGLDARVYCNFLMDSSVVHDNTAANGAGMMIFFDSDPVITNTTISFNHGISEVSGYFGEAGGIWISYLSDARLTNVTIKYNSADHNAGGIYCSGSSNSVFTNVIIHNNHAPKGGGIYLSNSNHRYYNCLIYQNSAVEYSGGGIYMDQSDPIFINTTITDNTANSTYGGGALYARYSDPQLINCILWDNEPDEINGYNENVIVEYSDIMGSYPGTGNIDTDPLFYYDPYVEDYTLDETSPCINAGNPDTTGLNLPLIDLAGNPRISDDIIDMGAYEYQFPGAGIELELTVFLEGPFNGTDMNTDLNPNDIPLNHPYNTTPWDYTGTESVVSIPNADVVDWVLIELRDTTDALLATGETMIARQAVFLLNDGLIVGLDGDRDKACLVYTPPITNNLFVVIWHRNHLGIMSASPVTESGGVYTYDFTTPVGQAYGTDVQKNLGSGIYGKYAGDGDANGDVNTGDKTIWTNQVGTKGYKSADFDLDGQVNNNDKNEIWIPNEGEGSQVPEGT